MRRSDVDNTIECTDTVNHDEKKNNVDKDKDKDWDFKKKNP